MSAALIAHREWLEADKAELSAYKRYKVTGAPKHLARMETAASARKAAKMRLIGLGEFRLIYGN